MVKRGLVILVFISLYGKRLDASESIKSNKGETITHKKVYMGNVEEHQLVFLKYSIAFLISELKRVIDVKMLWFF